LALAEALDLPETLAQALTSKSILYVRNNRLTEPRILLEGALAIALEHDLHAAALRAYNNLLVTLDASDRISESLMLVEQAIELARRVGDRSQEAAFVGGSVGTLYIVGRWDEALARAKEASESATTTFAQQNLLDVVFLHCERGELETARELLRRFAAVGESESAETSSSYAVLDARVLRAEGKPREALDRAERALATRDEYGTVSWVTKLAITEALECSLALGDLAKMRELLGIIDGLRPGELTPWFRAIRASFRARLAAATGDAEVESHFEDAERDYEGLGTPFFLAATQLEHGEWLVAQGRAHEAESHLTEAREIFEQLEAWPWLERLDVLAPTRTEVHA
jgi:tetratricopeptide (TPR) repeat protein